jgi:uncharacterized protein YkwD
MNLFLIVLMLVFSSVDQRKDVVAESSSYSYADSIDKEKLLQLINDARANGVTCEGTYYPPVPEITWNDALETAAQQHCNDMLQHRYFSHTGSDGSDAGSRMEQAGYRWKFFGENIGMGYKNEQEVVDGWLHSPGHCKNIMDKNFKEMGIARAGNYWTQDLGGK